jgi:hypothetical protein
LNLALVAAVLFLGGLLLERAFLSFRWPLAYFVAGFALFPELVPIPVAPKAEAGRTATVQWERRDDLVLYWAVPGAKESPMGLHGAVRLWRGPRGVHLIVRWSPPWSPLLAAAWLGGLGIARQDYWAVPVAVMLVIAVLYGYRMYAVRAAAELRWAFVSGRDEGQTN